MKKKIIITVAAILVLSLAAGASYYAFTPTYRENTDPVTEDTADTDDGDTAEEQNEAEQTQPDETNQPLTEADSRDSNETQQTKPIISTLEQTGETVVVRAVLNDISSGTCRVTFTNGNQTVKEAAPVSLVTSYYTCQGFDIKKSRFKASGTWEVQLSVETAGKTLTSVKRTIQIR